MSHLLIGFLELDSPKCKVFCLGPKKSASLEKKKNGYEKIWNGDERPGDGDSIK